MINNAPINVVSANWMSHCFFFFNGKCNDNVMLLKVFSSIQFQSICARFTFNTPPAVGTHAHTHTHTPDGGKRSRAVVRIWKPSKNSNYFSSFIFTSSAFRPRFSSSILFSMPVSVVAIILTIFWPHASRQTTYTTSAVEGWWWAYNVASSKFETLSQEDDDERMSVRARQSRRIKKLGGSRFTRLVGRLVGRRFTGLGRFEKKRLLIVVEKTRKRCGIKRWSENEQHS